MAGQELQVLGGMQGRTWAPILLQLADLGGRQGIIEHEQRLHSQPWLS